MAAVVRQVARQGGDTPVREHTDMMEAVVERGNMIEAFKRVVSNKGAGGVDGMGVDELKPYLQTQWERIKEQLLEGRYQPVRRVEIPKPGGGMRQLGIPTVVDRLIQQALHQILNPLFDPLLSSRGHNGRRDCHSVDNGYAARRAAFTAVIQYFAG